MAGERLVVSYAAISSAAQAISSGKSILADVMSAVSDVGNESLHAGKLDEALQDYAGLLRRVGDELTGKFEQLATFLASSEEMYRFVDQTALDRAVPLATSGGYVPSPTLTIPAAVPALPGTPAVLTELFSGPGAAYAPDRTNAPLLGEPGPAAGVPNPTATQQPGTTEVYGFDLPEGQREGPTE